MKFQTPLSGEDSARYAALVEQSTCITKHAELLEWLQQGDIQVCLPHDILLAGWGNFQEGAVQHDVVSALPGVRSYAAGTDGLQGPRRGRFGARGRQRDRSAQDEWENQISKNRPATGIPVGSSGQGTLPCWGHGANRPPRGVGPSIH